MKAITTMTPRQYRAGGFSSSTRTPKTVAVIVSIEAMTETLLLSYSC